MFMFAIATLAHFTCMLIILFSLQFNINLGEKMAISTLTINGHWQFAGL